MNLVIDSYVEGDIDFIFGSSDCVFINTKLKNTRLQNNTHSFKIKFI